MIANILVGFVALLHAWFLVLEMFLWQKPIGLKVFGQSREQAKASAVLAANQGLYNGFLVAGLILGLLLSDPGQAFLFKAFFLGCVVVAGIYGGWTVNVRILVIQAGPAALGLAFLLASR